MSKKYHLPSVMGSILKGKNLLPLGANSFLLEKTPFQKALWCAGKQTESHRSCLPYIDSKIYAKCIQSPKVFTLIEPQFGKKVH